MMQILSKLSINTILKLWTLLTIMFIVAGIIVFSYDLDKKSFVVMVNIINIFSFVVFFIFREKIETNVTELMDESKYLSINIENIYEANIGYILIALFILMGAILIFFALFNVSRYQLLLKEDGVIESGSAIFWLLAAGVSFAYVIKLLKNKSRKRQIINNILLMFFFFLCLGEEISWGQRIFGIKTPELLSQVNIQNETNLHNIGSISVFSNLFFLITLTFFLLIPYLIKKDEQAKKLLYYVYFPVPSRFAINIYLGTLLVWIVVGIRFGTLGFHPFSFYPEHYDTQMDDEIFEFLVAYSFLCFSILNSTTRLILKKNTLSK